MSERIIRGYWDCDQCGTKNIDGLVDKCPSCGRQKPANVHYKMRDPNDVVSEEELNKAGIKKEECDGNHKEWVCAFCNQLNNWADQTCVSCGASKSDAKYEYGHQKIKKRESCQTEIYESDENNHIAKNEDTDTSECFIYSNTSNSNYESSDYESLKANEIAKPLIYIAMTVLTVLFIIGLFFPYKVTQTITGFSWYRDIAIEELQTFDGNGWSLPTNARLHETKVELYGYQDVLDHYDSVPVTKTRQVQDGYETHISYTDNGNGTFTEHTSQTPKYRTETYTEIEQKPVYRSEPVYKTKYYYEYDKWVVIDHFQSSGKNKEPYWNTDYKLKDNQRDTKRTEEYKIFLCDEKEKIAEKKVDYESWQSYDVGDTFSVTRCLIGIQYKRELID